MNIQILNNLNTQMDRIDIGILPEIEELISLNYRSTNNDEYSDDEIERLLLNKNSENIFNFMQNGLSVIVSDNSKIIGFGMIVRKNNIYEAKYLNVHPDYKGQGIGKKICEIREKSLKDIGIRELYIESLRFKKTLSFHKNRGFYDIASMRKLNFTNYMKKDL